MKHYTKKLRNILRSIGNFIFIVSMWIVMTTVSAIISVIFNISIDILLQLEIGIVLIIFAIIDIYVIRVIPKNLIMYILLCLGIISLLWIGSSLTIGAINLII